MKNQFMERRLGDVTYCGGRDSGLGRSFLFFLFLFAGCRDVGCGAVRQHDLDGAESSLRGGERCAEEHQARRGLRRPSSAAADQRQEGREGRKVPPPENLQVARRTIRKCSIAGRC